MQRYAITDCRLLPTHLEGREAAMRAKLQQWVGSGIEWVQLREKDLPEAALASLACSLALITRSPGSITKLLVNGLRPRLAQECGADGVHLPSGATAEAVRAAAQDAGLVTVSCHTLQEVEAARKGGAAAVLWAPVFGKVVFKETTGHVPRKKSSQEALHKQLDYKEVQPGTGLPALHAACIAAAPMPVFALGGISIANAAACIRAGAAGVAGIRLFHGDTWRALG